MKEFFAMKINELTQKDGFWRYNTIAFTWNVRLFML